MTGGGVSNRIRNKLYRPSVFKMVIHVHVMLPYVFLV